MGIERLGTGAIVMPELEEHVASKLGAKAQVLKERRKAREEAAAVRGLGAAATLPDKDNKETKPSGKFGGRGGGRGR